MPPTTDKVHRIHIAVTKDLLDRIELYRSSNAIPNRTIAVTELVRMGLKQGEMK